MAARPPPSAGIELVIARPTGIYGPGDRRLLKLFRGVARRRFVILGDGEIFYHLTLHRRPGAKASGCAATVPAAAGRTYILAGGEVTTLNELVRDHRGASPACSRRALHLPVWPFWIAGAACEAVCAPFGIEPPIYRRRVDFFTQEPRVRHHARAHRARLSRRRVGLRDGIGRTLDVVPRGRVAVMRGAPASRARRTQLFDARQVGARRSTRALVVGRPGLGRAAAATSSCSCCRQWVPGALGLALRKTLLSVAARRLRPQRRLRPERRAAPSAQDPHRRRRRRSTTTACSTPRATRNAGITHRQRRVHRPQHDPVVQERRHRRSATAPTSGSTARSSRPAASTIGPRHAARGLLLRDRRRPRLAAIASRAGARAGPPSPPACAIGAGAWLGAGAKILDGVTIGDRAIVGAGAVVREAVPARRDRGRRARPGSSAARRQSGAAAGEPGGAEPA